MIKRFSFLLVMFLIAFLSPVCITADDSPKESIKWTSEDIFIQAENIDTKEPGITVATGYVEILYQNQHIQADRIVYDRNVGIMYATGNVTFQTDEISISCREMEFKINGEGVFSDALIYAGAYIIRADKLVREKDQSLTLDSAIITPCAQITPCWEMKVSSGKIVIGDYVFLKGIFFRIKKIPILYVPAFYLPLDEETGRTAGFLFPEFGSSTRYGTTIKAGFYWPISRSMDATIYATYFSEKGTGYGLEGRYSIDRVSRGIFDIFYLKEDDTGNERYNFNVNHRQSIGGWKFSITGKMQSDISYAQDYAQSLEQISSRSSNYLNASVSKRFGSFNFRVISQYKESIVAGDTTSVKSKLPSLNLSLKPQKLFDMPVYFSFKTDYSFLKKVTKSSDYEYQRFDMTTELSANLETFPWLKVAPKLKFRHTNYTNSLDPETKLLAGEQVSRDYYSFDVRIIGPVLYKIFQTPELEYADKFKHIIEPSISYKYVSEPTNRDLVLYYDGVDSALPVNEVRFTLDNKILANQKIGPDRYKAREIFSWKITQHVSLDDTLSSSYGSQYNRFSTNQITTLSPMVSTLKFRPTDQISLSNRLEYNHEFEQMASLNLIIDWASESFVTNIRWMKTFDLDETRIPSDQISASGRFSMFDKLFDLSYRLSYNVEDDLFWQGNVALRYNHQCFSMIFSYDYFNIGLRQEDRFGFNVELTGISGMMSDVMK